MHLNDGNGDRTHTEIETWPFHSGRKFDDFGGFESVDVGIVLQRVAQGGRRIGTDGERTRLKNGHLALRAQNVFPGRDAIEPV